MKKVLFFTIAIAASTISSLSAQSLPSSNDLTKVATDAVSQVGSAQAGQITEALTQNKKLQKKTLKHLKSDPATKDAIMDMASKNGGKLDDMIKSVLGDTDLTKAAVDYISKNPDLLKKAMKVIGM